VDAFLLVASQTPYWPNFGFPLKIMFLWYFLIPVLTPIFGYFPARRLGLFEDLPRNVALQWMRCAKRSNYIFDELPHLREQYELLQQPFKVISLSDDPYAPRKAAEDLLQFYTNVKLDHHHIRPNDIGEKHIGHFGFFKKRLESTLWKEATHWLKTVG
jgi:predicted alpha/beta hydrolase